MTPEVLQQSGRAVWWRIALCLVLGHWPQHVSRTVDLPDWGLTRTWTRCRFCRARLCWLGE